MNRDFLESKFIEYGELAFDLIIISVLAVIFALPIVTAGSAITASYYVLIERKKKENSMSALNIVKVFIKGFIKNIGQTTLTTVWIIISLISIHTILKVFSLGYIIMGVALFLIIEVLIYTQVIFYIYARADKLKYFNGVMNGIFIAHKKLPIIILSILIQVVFALIISRFNWMIIILIGLSFQINVILFDKYHVENQI